MNPDLNTESVPPISRRMLVDLFCEERPITVDEACDIRLLLFGSTSKSFSVEWEKQGFKFRPFPSYGLLQRYGGPCGVMAAVQAYVLYELLFGYSRTVLAEGFLRPSVAERREALSRALCDILWQAGHGKAVVVAKKSDHIVLEEISGILEGDEFLEYVKLMYFESRDSLLSHIFNFIQLFMNEGGCILFLYSVLLTHGIQKVKEEMDISEYNLIGPDNYCSLELVNLILIGKAVPNVHDGDINLNFEGKDSPLLLRGIHKQSKIGLLTMFDQRGLLSVGTHYKDPLYPIWVLQGDSHFTTLFGTTRDIFRQPFEIFRLFYFDCLLKRNQETILTINPNGEVAEDDQPEIRNVCLRCVKSRWPQATVEIEVISRD